MYNFFITVCIAAILMWAFIGMNQKYKPNEKSGNHGVILFTIALVCLCISFVMNPELNKSANIDDMTDQQLCEYIAEMDEDKIDAWFSKLTDRQQTRVFHVYMLNKLEIKAEEDAFE